MQRGVIELSKQEIDALIKNVDWENISFTLFDRFHANLPTYSGNVKIFLSEEEVETILDAISFSESSERVIVNEICNKLREFLVKLRNHEVNSSQ